MNKLYKYLPFDIKVQFDNKVWDLLGCYSESYSTKVWLGFNENELLQHRSTPEISNVKPILRSFDDLTKELPLTKAAAEMIGMKERDVVKVIMYFFKLVANNFNLYDDCYSYQEHMNGDFLVKVHRFNSTITEGIDLYENWQFTRSYKTRVDYDEKPFDFLRAMHFAVDFKEDEYIKLKD